VHCFIFANDIIPGSDQMQEIMLGRKFASGDLYGVLDTYWAPLYPILIGIASFFIDSPIVPAILVSLLASSLTVPLTYIFVLQSYGPREAVVAGMIALFFPHFINSVVGVGSENVFVALMLGVLVVSWNALLTGSIVRYLAAGLLLGLAYLTRPEAIGYSLYFVFVFIAVDLWRRRPFLKGSLPRAAVFLLGFILLAAPYLMYLRGETGRWTVSGKAEINTLAAQIEDGAAGMEHGPTTQQAKEFAKYFLLNLIEVQKMFPVLFPLLLWPFIGLGLFTGAWERPRVERELFLISFCLVTIVGYAAAVVQLRYFYVLLPVLMGWAACGIVGFAGWFRDTAFRSIAEKPDPLKPGHLAVLTTFLIFIYVLPLNFYMRSVDRRWETSGYEERDAGLWLKQHSVGEPFVFSASRRPVFYAEGKQLAPKTVDMAQIRNETKQEGVQYIVTSERSLKRNPFLAGFDEVLKSDPDYQLIYHRNDYPGYAISIFSLK
jgi:4-amino-4-deoxy-L-arabinose transferase-like glycosyltransferase